MADFLIHQLDNYAAAFFLNYTASGIHTLLNELLFF